MEKRNIIISVQRKNVTNTGFKPPKDLQFAFENQLFEHIHYWTETNVNLLLNTCSFRSKFWFIFSLILSENAPNVHFREAKFQNFPGSIPPDPPSLLAPSAWHKVKNCGSIDPLYCRSFIKNMSWEIHSYIHVKYTTRHTVLLPVKRLVCHIS